MQGQSTEAAKLSICVYVRVSWCMQGSRSQCPLLPCTGRPSAFSRSSLLTSQAANAVLAQALDDLAVYAGQLHQRRKGIARAATGLAHSHSQRLGNALHHLHTGKSRRLWWCEGRGDGSVHTPVCVVSSSCAAHVQVCACCSPDAGRYCIGRPAVMWGACRAHHPAISQLVAGDGGHLDHLLQQQWALGTHIAAE